MAVLTCQWTVYGVRSVTDTGTMPKLQRSAAPLASTPGSRTTRRVTCSLKMITLQFTSPMFIVRAKRAPCLTAHTRDGRRQNQLLVNHTRKMPQCIATIQVHLILKKNTNTTNMHTMNSWLKQNNLESLARYL